MKRELVVSMLLHRREWAREWARGLEIAMKEIDNQVVDARVKRHTDIAFDEPLVRLQDRVHENWRTASGGLISILAGGGVAYSTPRGKGPFTHYEIALFDESNDWVTEVHPMLSDYADSQAGDTRVYAYVPADIVQELILAEMAELTEDTI